MTRRRSTPLWIPALAVAAIVAACSDDSPTPAPVGVLVGTRNATSLSAFGRDFIAEGMTLTATFASATYDIAVTGDLIGVCDPNPDCTTSGTYTTTATTVTLDRNTPDEVTLNYTIQGTTLTISGLINSVPATIRLTRAALASLTAS